MNEQLQKKREWQVPVLVDFNAFDSVTGGRGTVFTPPNGKYSRTNEFTATPSLTTHTDGTFTIYYKTVFGPTTT